MILPCLVCFHAIPLFRGPNSTAMNFSGDLIARIFSRALATRAEKSFPGTEILEEKFLNLKLLLVEKEQ